jgi:RNA polymerase sigma-70 factor (ECF subfamily)
MIDMPKTRYSLLVRLRDPRDHEAWLQFSSIYRPVVYRLARVRGLQDADADELAQQVMLAVYKAIPTWRRSSPEVRFHHWLRRVIANAIHNVLSRRPRDVATGGTKAFALNSMLIKSGSVEIDSEVETAYRRQLLRRAAQIVCERADDTTWQAFKLTTLDGVAIAEVAKMLCCSVGRVYAARCRIVRRLRDTVRALEAEFNEP